MKNRTSFSLLMVSALTFTACAPKSSSSAEATKKLDEVVQNLPDPNKIVAELMASLGKGAQPGAIKVIGIVVKETSKVEGDLNPALENGKLNILRQGSIGKDGKKSPVTSLNPVTLSAENPDVDLKIEMDLNTLVAIGCSEELANQTARTRSLELEPVPAPQNADFMSISAKTILMCGNLAGMNYGLLSLSADEIIMEEVNYLRTDNGGWIKIFANKLMLNADNTITTKGIDSSQPVSATPSFELHIGKELVANETGRLNLVAFGANYAAPTETAIDSKPEPKTETTPDTKPEPKPETASTIPGPANKSAKATR